MEKEELAREFDRQVATLLEKGYPEIAGMGKDAFLEIVTPLKEILLLHHLSPIDNEKGYLPFVIVIKSDVIPTEIAMSGVEKDGKEGITKLYPHTPKDFEVIGDEQIPEGPAYVLLAIDRGKKTINIPPVDAMKQMRNEDRHPLTIDEGVAIITHYPEFLKKNNCFSLLSSRHSGDKRVPAIWINAKKNPHLGWCWDGNPHTWLGSASCKERLGYESR